MWNWIKKFLGLGETSSTVEQAVVTTELVAVEEEVSPTELVTPKAPALEGEIVMPLTGQELEVALKAMQPGEKKIFYLVEDPANPDMQMIFMFAAMHHERIMFQNIDPDRRTMEVTLSE